MLGEMNRDVGISFLSLCIAFLAILPADLSFVCIHAGLCVCTRASWKQISWTMFEGKFESIFIILPI